MKLSTEPFYICVYIGFGMGTAIIALIGAILSFMISWTNVKRKRLNMKNGGSNEVH